VFPADASLPVSASIRNGTIVPERCIRPIRTAPVGSIAKLRCFAAPHEVLDEFQRAESSFHDIQPTSAGELKVHVIKKAQYLEVNFLTNKYLKSRIISTPYLVRPA
jgi:hypothetical protein